MRDSGVGNIDLEHYHTSKVGEVLREATPRLSPITDAPHLEAEVLLGHVLEVSRAALLAHPEHILTSKQQARYELLLSRRVSHYPLPYITGHVEFYGLEFEVTPEVLIPRPETETLVDLALKHHPATVVDVGTGSGCIAVALAVHLPEVNVYAIDISSAALAVARRNVERHEVSGRVRLMAGDMLSPRPGPVDLIVSNPPYIPTGKCGALPISVRDHEPRLALDGGTEGLDMIQQLFAEAPAVLHSDGRILTEIGADQGDAASYLAHTYFPQAVVEVHPDLAGRDRVLEVLPYPEEQT